MAEENSICKQKEKLKTSINNFLKNDPKSSISISISSAYGFATVGYDASLFLEMLEKECK